MRGVVHECDFALPDRVGAAPSFCRRPYDWVFEFQAAYTGRCCSTRRHEQCSFPSQSGNFSYGEFYLDFGLFPTAYLLFSAFLAWHLGGLAQNDPQAIGALGWAFFAVQMVSLILSWVYFFVPPAVFSALVAACLGWAAWLVQNAKA